jgi:hypothetical protein
MAVIALLNLGLVLFDLSYIPWRDFYLRELPQATTWYGARFKGIQPHQTTTAYSAAVERLAAEVATSGLQSESVSQQLAQLQVLSIELVDENPFEAVNKSGTLERIKNRMREQIGVDSSKAAFSQFWSQDYLTQAGWEPSIQFFQREIQPLLAINYYRSIGENGEFINRFWQIDIWFSALFAAELFTRLFYLRRRYPRTSWLDVTIWRCYDLLLLLPFWRWLRIIPVVIRLDQAKLVNFQPINHRIVRALISSVAVELTEMVVVRLIEQSQELIRRGEVSRWLLQSERYIDLNGVNEVEAITRHLSSILVYQVLPQVKPQVEALLRHSVSQVVSRSPVYSGLQQVPGVGAISHQITEQVTNQIVADLSKTLYEVLQTMLEDETGAALISQLISRLGQTFSQTLKQDQALTEVQSLTVALLDEIKINYVERLAAEDLESLQAQSKRIYQITQPPDLRSS